MLNFATRALLAALLTALSLTANAARELKVGLAAAITSMDPHYHNYSPNNSMARHVFEPLIRQDVNQKLVPALARTWRNMDELTWEFTLRRNVRFHDGTPFTAADAAFTLKRAGNVPNSPSSFGVFTRGIADVKVVDDVTLHIKTPSSRKSMAKARALMTTTRAKPPSVPARTNSVAMCRIKRLS
jgi:peptide/nickel transport system substrate-binding protein